MASASPTPECPPRITIRVQREDGEIEMLTVCGEARVVEGRQLDRLVTADMEHFFTKAGFYDGWGMPTESTGPEASELVEAVERGRRLSGR